MQNTYKFYGIKAPVKMDSLIPRGEYKDTTKSDMKFHVYINE